MSVLLWHREPVVKSCAGCAEIKAENEFNARSRSTDGLQPYCRDCQRQYYGRHYAANRAAYVQKQRSRCERLREVNCEELRVYLLAHPCVDCHEADPLVLEFDHRDRTEKSRNVTDMLIDYEWSIIVRKIEKCDVRCANCHRRRTIRELGWTTRVHA
jgi:hypothetical protein